MKKIILTSLLAFSFLTVSVNASEGVFVNDYVNTETYPDGNTLENDFKKEKEYLKGIFDFDFDLDQSYELRKNTGEKTYLYTEDSLVTKDGLDISFRYGPYSKDYEKAAASFKKSKIKGLDALISRAGEFNGGKDSVYSADFKFDGIYYILTIRGTSESDFAKIVEKVITNILYNLPRGDASLESLVQDDFKGDSSYAEGMYLPDMSVSGKYHFKNGEAINPYGKSMVGKISDIEKKKILNKKQVKKLIKIYNRCYRTTVKLYRYGEKNIDKWKKVNNMTDPVFGSFTKEKWVYYYNKSIKVLSNTKYYFYRLGLDDSDFIEKETFDLIGNDSRFVLTLNKYKK
ncbi:hypothetical protein [Anaerococcus sp. Marseille-P3915]|uniref:hypothetical protein n=1 Tax=Anaerococcus sp. Marseille-P3915 TaxID=2057799 RepID=UPI000D0AFEF7|nr:hypothetical protein [Anaerococcus sp. Marseille-P3915]